MGKRKRNIATLNIAIGNTPPTEFRLLVKGPNDTEYGTFLFDDAAAASVMAAYEKWGVDLAIDLEHQMLDDGIAPDPTAKDARGWFRLELRPDGSLWATNVRWTSDGAARLTEKRQRYISPALAFDPKTMRVTKIINAAITSIPATHDTPALVAASANGANTMDPSQVKAALDALIEGDTEACAEILKSIIATAASGGEAAPSAPEAKPAPAKPGEKPAPAKAAPEEVAAASSVLRTLGVGTFRDAAGELVRLKKENQSLSHANAAYEAAERVHICRGMVAAGKAPASVWDQAAYKLGETPVPLPIFQKLSLKELREHAEREIATLGGPRPAVRTNAFMPPAGPPAVTDDEGPVDAYGNTKRELAICKDAGCDPEVFSKLKAARARQVSA